MCASFGERRSASLYRRATTYPFCLIFSIWFVLLCWRFRPPNVFHILALDGRPDLDVLIGENLNAEVSRMMFSH